MLPVQQQQQQPPPSRRRRPPPPPLNLESSSDSDQDVADVKLEEPPRRVNPDLDELRAQFKQKLRKQDEQDERRRQRAALMTPAVLPQPQASHPTQSTPPTQPLQPPQLPPTQSIPVDESEFESESESGSSSLSEDEAAAIELDGHEVWSRTFCCICDREIPLGTGVLADGAPVAPDPIASSTTLGAGSSRSKGSTGTSPSSSPLDELPPPRLAKQPQPPPLRLPPRTTRHAPSSSRDSSTSRPPTLPRAPSSTQSPSGSVNMTRAGGSSTSARLPPLPQPRPTFTPPFGPSTRSPLSTPGGSGNTSVHSARRVWAHEMKRAAAQSHRVPLYCSVACREEDWRGSTQWSSRAPTPASGLYWNGFNTSGTLPMGAPESGSAQHHRAYSYSGQAGPSAWNWACAGPPSAGMARYAPAPMTPWPAPPTQPNGKQRASPDLYRSASQASGFDDGAYGLQLPPPRRRRTNSGQVTSPLALYPAHVAATDYFDRAAPGQVSQSTTAGMDHPSSHKDQASVTTRDFAENTTDDQPQHSSAPKVLLAPSGALALGTAASARAVPPSTSLSTACASSFSRTLVPPSATLNAAARGSLSQGMAPSWSVSSLSQSQPNQSLSRSLSTSRSGESDRATVLGQAPSPPPPPPRLELSPPRSTDVPSMPASLLSSANQSLDLHKSSSPERTRSQSVSTGSVSGSVRSVEPLALFPEDDLPPISSALETLRRAQRRASSVRSESRGSRGSSSQASSAHSAQSPRVRKESSDTTDRLAGWWRSLWQHNVDHTPPPAPNSGRTGSGTLGTSGNSGASAEPLHRSTRSLHSLASDSTLSLISTDTSPSPPKGERRLAPTLLGKKAPLVRPHGKRQVPAYATRSSGRIPGVGDELGDMTYHLPPLTPSAAEPQRRNKSHRRSWAAELREEQQTPLPSRSATPGAYNDAVGLRRTTTPSLMPDLRLSVLEPPSRPGSRAASRPSSRPSSRPGSAMSMAGSFGAHTVQPGTSLPRRGGLGWGPNRLHPFPPAQGPEAHFDHARYALPAALTPCNPTFDHTPTTTPSHEPSRPPAPSHSHAHSRSLPIHDVYDHAWSEALGLTSSSTLNKAKGCARPAAARRVTVNETRSPPPRGKPLAGNHPITVVGGFGQLTEHPAEEEAQGDST